MSKIIMSTDRLTLRQMRKDDINHLLEIFSDPVAMKYYPSTKDESAANEWIDWTLSNYEKFGLGLWIVEAKETGEFLGQCGIVPQDIEGTIEMEIGYLFVRSKWGNGYATEAALACKNYGFNQLELPKLISLPDINNKPSIKVAERIGMILDKKIYKWEKDVYVYSVKR
ncbi:MULTISPECIES: GNAT family N-acetyltransferase [Bacillus]|uniref:N-acetyltransferase domain-containing protein n=2 Tax=Bacillus TaxID=1386 RepID=A0A0M5JDV4_9BACI|nr:MULTISPECIES: GNAT family N-acetyltransferase [Bacillus]ALC81244.1 hypothetical protein AM592_06280 [Bacillus gobiensis]MBP1080240.1 RimJ/RimL family protein N-acetyltransferase [Bacillus capparidis]MED1094109.1 GNAT family N-acetyltransferase [Bacillus capparidis]